MRKIVVIYFIFISILGQSKSLSAFVDFGRFKVNDSISFVELYIGIDAFSSEFEYIEHKKYQARIFASIKLLDEDKIIYFQQFNITSPYSEAEQPDFNKFNFSRRIPTKNKNYTCELVLKDENSSDTATTVRFEIDNRFEGEKIQFSDIQLLDNYERSNDKSDFVKSGFFMNPLTSIFYPSHINVLKYYVEIYNTDIDKLVGKDEPLVIFSTFRDRNGRLITDLGSYKRESGKPEIAMLSQIDISKLPSGNYFFVVEVRDKDNKLVSYTKKDIQRANLNLEQKDEADETLLSRNFTHAIPMHKIEYYLSCFRPRATEAEMHTINSLLVSSDSTQKRNYFFNFWYKRYKTKAQTEWMKYERDIIKVDNEFGCHGRPGYLTEQGRVFLQYGAPNRVETEFTDPTRNAGLMQKEYQIWQYYALGDLRNRFFVFFKGNPGSCEFDLIHSNAPSEIQNQDWVNNNNWREMLKRNNQPFLNNNINEERFSTDF